MLLNQRPPSSTIFLSPQSIPALLADSVQSWDQAVSMTVGMQKAASNHGCTTDWGVVDQVERIPIHMDGQSRPSLA